MERLRWPLLSLFGLLLLGLTIAPATSQQPSDPKAASTVYVATDAGTLKIETADDDVQVIVEKNGKQIDVIDKKKGAKVTLLSGEYKPADGEERKDVKVAKDGLQLLRDGVTVATIRKVNEVVVLRPKVAAEPQPSEPVKYVTNSIGVKLAPIAAGEFLMGTSAADLERFKTEPFGYFRPDATEGPQHKVKITKPFYLGAYTVTQGQYQKLMDANPSFFKDSADHPVDAVTWTEAVEFCKRLSALPDEKKAERVYRLPTDAEWEYACRAGTTTTTYFGNTLSSKQANFDGDHPLGNAEKGPKIGKPVKGGSYPPNSWGLYDMHGNLWQWCLDGPRVYTADAVTDPRGPDVDFMGHDARVLRGCSWRDGGVSSSGRKPRTVNYRVHIVGFRVLCER